jgi:hypothetical protein
LNCPKYSYFLSLSLFPFPFFVKMYSACLFMRTQLSLFVERNAHFDARIHPKWHFPSSASLQTTISPTYLIFTTHVKFIHPCFQGFVIQCFQR